MGAFALRRRHKAVEIPGIEKVIGRRGERGFAEGGRQEKEGLQKEGGGGRKKECGRNAGAAHRTASLHLKRLKYRISNTRSCRDYNIFRS